MVYVALLRGINVGGKNRVEMPRLKASFEKAGYKKVVTYINSGNIIFEANKPPDEQQIENIIEAEFGFNVPTIVRSQVNLEKIVASTPKKWANDSVQKTDVLFLWDEVNKPKLVKQFKINPQFESVFYVDGALIWNLDRRFIHKGQMIKIIGTPLYKKLTIRNINTVRKLTEMMQNV